MSSNISVSWIRIKGEKSTKSCKKRKKNIFSHKSQQLENKRFNLSMLYQVLAWRLAKQFLIFMNFWSGSIFFIKEKSFHFCQINLVLVYWRKIPLAWHLNFETGMFINNAKTWANNWWQGLDAFFNPFRWFPWKYDCTPSPTENLLQIQNIISVKIDVLHL